MLQELTRDIFDQQINTPFRVEHGAGSATLELVEVSAVSLTSTTESFSIVFRGPLDAFLAQSVYRFHHDVLGAVDLFIVPIGKEKQGFLYESVFNYLRRET